MVFLRQGFKQGTTVSSDSSWVSSSFIYALAAEEIGPLSFWTGEMNFTHNSVGILIFLVQVFLSYTDAIYFIYFYLSLNFEGEVIYP